MGTIAKIRRLYFTKGKRLKTVCRDLKLSKNVVLKVTFDASTVLEFLAFIRPEVRESVASYREKRAPESLTGSVTEAAVCGS